MGFDDVNADLNRGGKVAKFDRIGDSITGLLIDAEKIPLTDINGKVVVDEKTGAERTQVLYTLQTEDRDPQDPFDDGRRRVYAKWAIQSAISDELKEKGLLSVGLQENGKLTLIHSETRPAKTRGYNDAKLFKASYEPPAPRSLGGAEAVAESPWDGNKPADPSDKYSQEAINLALKVFAQNPETPMSVIATVSTIDEKDLPAILAI